MTVIGMCPFAPWGCPVCMTLQSVRDNIPVVLLGIIIMAYIIYLRRATE